MLTDRRVFTTQIEVRAAEGETGEILIAGYAARFMSLSEDLGGFRERILPGAFTRTLASNRDFVLLYDHNWANILGRTSNKTLKLFEDSHGLRMEGNLPQTQLGKDTAVLLRDGYLTKMSFGFSIVNSSVIEEKGEYVQELRDVELYEVSIVTMPAYESTKVSLRKADLEKLQARNGLSWQHYDLLQRQAEAELRHSL